MLTPPHKKKKQLDQESMIDELLDENIKDIKTLKRRTAKLYDGLKYNIYLCVVDIMQYDHTNTLLGYFRDLFKKIQSEYMYYIHLNNVIIIISTDDDALSIDKDLNKLNDFFEKYKIYAGISGQFQDLIEFKKRYREAINALNYGLDSKRNQQIFLYDNFRVQHFLNSANDSFNISDICNPIVFLIDEYDKENDTQLIDIIYNYLLYGMDIVAAGEALRTTPEELSFMLKKINELFEIDWKNGDMLLNIFISIKLLDDI